jgi:membrane fusion protein, multidrug efflux system
MPNNFLKKVIILAAIAFSTAAFYITRTQMKVFTVDNSYVSGQIIKIKAPLSGIIERVNVQIGDKLQRQDVILIYDQVASQYQLEKSREQFQQTIRHDFQQCLEESVRMGEVQLKKLEYGRQQKQLARGEKLRKMNVLAESTYDDIVFQYDSSSINKDISRIESTVLEYANPEPILQRPQVRLSQLLFQEALHNQQLTSIEAPTNGYVYDLFVYPNQFVEKGDVVAVLVSSDHLRIEANVLESEVGKLQPNMKIDIISDVHKDITLKGHIHSIVPSTAASFSPIPRNNMDSNWIKVSQRVPVLVEIDENDKSLLPIGSSSKLRVYLDEYVDSTIPREISNVKVSTEPPESARLIQRIIAGEKKLAGLSTNQQRCKL